MIVEEPLHISFEEFRKGKPPLLKMTSIQRARALCIWLDEVRVDYGEGADLWFAVLSQTIMELGGWWVRKDVKNSDPDPDISPKADEAFLSNCMFPIIAAAGLRSEIVYQGLAEANLLKIPR